MLLVTGFLSCIFVASIAATNSNRIVGGESTRIEDVPFQVAVRLTNNHLCGGAIISENWIVSSANCMSRSDELYSIRIGSTSTEEGGTIHTIRSIMIHPEYSAHRRVNDIALILVSDPIAFSVSVQPIVMSEPGDIVEPERTLQISGWGHEQYLGNHWSMNLQRGGVSLVDKVQCQSAYGTTALIEESMLCASNAENGTDVCLGDFGGPLVSEWKLVGIASFGTACGNRGIPSVYANIAAYRDWITELTNIRY